MSTTRFRRKANVFSRLIVGNFKSIRDTTEIDLRPITLLFGPNAAGKSSIIHAVHYLYELLSGSSRDVHGTTLSGRQLDLGGFNQVVHGCDPNGRITLGVEFKLQPESFGNTEPISIVAPDFFLSGVSGADDLRKKIRSYQITVVVGRIDADAQVPTVNEARISINDEPLAVIVNRGKTDFTFANRTIRLNLRHPLIEDTDNAGQADQQHWMARVVADKTAQALAIEDGVLEFPVSFENLEPNVLREIEDALPLPQSRIALNMPFGKKTDDVAEQFEEVFKQLAATPDADRQADVAALNSVLNVTIAELISHAANALKDVIHVGPLRALPRRDGRYIGSAANSSWYDGGGAWTLLQTSKAVAQTEGAYSVLFEKMMQGLLDQLNAFLHDNRLLGTALKLEFVRERRFRDNRDEVTRVEMHNEWETDSEERLPVPELSPFAKLVSTDDARLAGKSKEQLVALLQQIAAAVEQMPSEHWMILRDETRGIDLTLQDVGVGIAQAIPALIAMFDVGLRGIRMIEQPELHLHPRAQVALGDALIHGAAMRRWNEAALFETHSEHLLLRLLRRVRAFATAADGEEVPFALLPENLAVIYVEPSPNGSIVRRLRVDETGEFIDRWPNGFFDERGGEIFS